MQKCYQQRARILLENQDIFRCPVDIMIQQRSIGYLIAWLTMFQALVLVGEREVQHSRSLNMQEEEDDDSTATFSTVDLEEYLLDVTDGMDREWDIDDGGAVLTSPRQSVCSKDGQSGSEVQGMEEEWVQQQVDTVEVEAGATGSQREFGEVELRKRKPPDGEP